MNMGTLNAESSFSYKHITRSKSKDGQITVQFVLWLVIK
jgi:hypothetical protein